MKRLARMAFAAVLPLLLASTANSQVINLLVGNQTSFNALDRYAYPSRLYQGAFAGPGTGPPGAFLFTYGPDGNIYLERNVPNATILKYDGHTGNPLGTFVSDPGAYFTFGPDGNVYRLNSAGNAVLRYNGTTGQLIGTFVSTNITNGGGFLAFGPNNDLFVTDAPTIKRFNGLSGAFI